MGTKADGKCNVCGQPISHMGNHLLSQFQCSEECRRKGWAHHNPDLPIPDWDELEIELDARFGRQPRLPRWRKRTGVAGTVHRFFHIYEDEF